MQRPGSVGREFKPFSVMNKECQSAPRSDFCRHINDPAQPPPTTGKGPAPVYSPPHFGRGGKGGRESSPPEPMVVPGDQSRVPASRINPVTGLFDSSVARIAMHEHRLAERARLLGGTGGNPEQKTEIVPVPAADRIEPAGVIGKGGGEIGTSAVMQQGVWEDRGQGALGVAGGGSRQPQTFNAPRANTTKEALEELERRRKEENSTPTVTRGEFETKAHYGDVALDADTALVTPTFLEGTSHPIWPYTNPNDDGAGAGGDSLDGGYDAGVFGKADVLNTKNYIYTTYHLSGRTSQFEFILPEDDGLDDVVHVQVLRFAMVNLTPIVSNHNNTLRIVDNLFTSEPTERLLRLDDLELNQPGYGVTITLSEQILTNIVTLVGAMPMIIRKLNASPDDHPADLFGYPLYAPGTPRYSAGLVNPSLPSIPFTDYKGDTYYSNPITSDDWKVFMLQMLSGEYGATPPIKVYRPLDRLALAPTDHRVASIVLRPPLQWGGQDWVLNKLQLWNTAGDDVLNELDSANISIVAGSTNLRTVRTYGENNGWPLESMYGENNVMVSSYAPSVYDTREKWELEDVLIGTTTYTTIKTMRPHTSGYVYLQTVLFNFFSQSTWDPVVLGRTPGNNSHLWSLEPVTGELDTYYLQSNVSVFGNNYLQWSNSGAPNNGGVVTVTAYHGGDSQKWVISETTESGSISNQDSARRIIWSHLTSHMSVSLPDDELNAAVAQEGLEDYITLQDLRLTVTLDEPVAMSDLNELLTINMINNLAEGTTSYRVSLRDTTGVTIHEFEINAEDAEVGRCKFHDRELVRSSDEFSDNPVWSMTEASLQDKYTILQIFDKPVPYETGYESVLYLASDGTTLVPVRQVAFFLSEVDVTLNAAQQSAFNELENWRFEIKLVDNPTAAGGGPTYRFSVNDSDLLGQLGVVASSEPGTVNDVSKSFPMRLDDTSKSLNLYVNGQRAPNETLYYQKAAQSIDIRNAYEWPENKIKQLRRGYQTTTKTTKIPIELRIGDHESELFNTYHQTFNMTLAVTHLSE